MGCCSSRESRPSPYASPALPSSQIQQAAASSSSRAAIINNTPAAAARSSSVSRLSSSSPRASDPAQQRRAAATSSPDGRPNAPLRPPSPVAASPDDLTLQPWTRAELARQRDAFFETRVSGSAEVWSALKLVCDMLRAGDLAAAQGVLDAAGLTCPTGRVVGDRRNAKGGKGVYDERGLLYEIPGWVVRDPADVVDDDDDEEKKTSASLERPGAVTEVEETPQQREEKGKGREEDVGEVVSIRARLSDRGTDVLVPVGREQKLAVLVRRIQDKAGVAGRIKLAYLGKIMDEEKTLAEAGWRDGHVVNALVFE
ncbi:hypothetical protein MBLNU459_g6871t1 [Dothideomycetes sp. NU459]